MAWKGEEWWEESEQRERFNNRKEKDKGYITIYYFIDV